MSTATKMTTEGVLILASLAGGSKHGYAIQQDVFELTGRRLGPGSLYGAIARLENAGYVDALGSSGPRRPYRLTASGAGALKAEVAASALIGRVAARRLATR